MVIIEIDDKSKESKLLIEYLASQKFVHIHRSPNKETEKALADVEKNKTHKVKNYKELMNELKS